MHRLLVRQLRRVGRLPDPRDPLLGLVSAAYEELDRERQRLERTHRVLSEEIEALNRNVRDEAEARIRAIFNHVGEGIVVVGETGLVDAMNPVAARILGVEHEDFTGRPFEWFWPDEDTRPILRPGKQTVERRAAEGATIPLELNISRCLLGTSWGHIVLERRSRTWICDSRYLA